MTLQVTVETGISHVVNITTSPTIRFLEKLHEFLLLMNQTIRRRNVIAVTGAMPFPCSRLFAKMIRGLTRHLKAMCVEYAYPAAQ